MVIGTVVQDPENVDVNTAMPDPDPVASVVIESEPLNLFEVKV
jgi:hypothetical protein